MLSKLKQWLPVAVLASTLAAPMPSMASPPPTQYNSFWLNLSFGAGLSQLASFTNNFLLTNQSFVDDYFFNLPPPSASFAVAGNSGFGITFVPPSGIQLSQAISFGSVDLYAISGETIDLAKQVQSDSFQAVAVNDHLTGGVYVLEITGTSLVAGGSYYGGLQAEVNSLPPPPVPEPETLAMMLCGLGMLAMLTKRRRERQD